MRRHVLLCTVLMGLIIVAGEAEGATRYVRQGATGNGSGTDWTNAYSTLPATLVRGDVYYIADGTYGGYNFDEPISGTSLITIRKATVADHGVNTGWSNTYGDGQAVFTNALTFSTSNWLFDGATRSSLESGHGFKIDNSGGGFETAITIGGSGVSNVTIQYLEAVGFNSGCTASWGGDGASYDIQGSNGVTLAYVKIHRFTVPITIDRSTNFKVTQSLFAENFSNPTCHSEVIAASRDNNMIISHNVMRDIEGTGFIVHLSRGAGKTGGANWQIYGNTFYRDRSEGVGDGVIACINTMPCTNWVIYNNTFVDINKGFGSRIAFAQAASGSSVVVRNNLWQSSGAANHSCVAGVSCTFSHNTYTDTESVNSSEANIQVRNAFNWFVNATALDFHLVTATSPGFTLPSPYDLTPDGVPRNGSRGAYEVGGASEGLPPPAAPTAVRIITN